MTRAAVILTLLAAVLAGCPSPPASPPDASPSSTGQAEPWIVIDADGKARRKGPLAPGADAATRHAAGITLEQVLQIVDVVEAANRIKGRPYLVGGGRAPYLGAGHKPDGEPAPGYDGPRAVSFALYGSRMVAEPMSREELRDFGKPGPGQWITVYVCAASAHLVVVGASFAVYAVAVEGRSGAQWRSPVRRARGCVERHPESL